ncbi:uncharacterized protein LOC144639023 [Oculina patagonica]
MFCHHCGTSVGANSNYCVKCGKGINEFISELVQDGKEMADACKPGPSGCSEPPKGKGAFGRVLSFKEYYEHKTKADCGRQVPSKKNQKNKGTKGKEINPEVVIFIGLMEWSEDESNLKPRRGKRLALKVPRDAPYKVLCEKAVEKWKSFNSNLYEEGEDYVLLLDDGKEALFLPGPAKEFFSLHRYQEEVGKDFKRITLYLCTAKEFKHSETVGLDWNDEPENEYEDSADKQGENSSKRLKIDLTSSDECSERSEIGETEIQIKHDEEVAMELQRQLLEETTHNEVAATSADVSVKEQEIEIKSTKNFTSPTAVVQELEKRVDKTNQFFITIRRQTPLPRVLNLWRYEAKRQGGHHQIKVKFLGENGIDSGALAREFFTEVIPAVGNTLFPNGSPIDSTYHVQNGNFRTAGEIVANSLAQGGPPPCFLDEVAFQTLVNPKLDILNLSEENDLTQSEQQLLDSIKSDIDNHRDTILEHGYTGPIDMAHIDGIVRSVAVSLVNKRILYLQEFKEGLKMYGLADIVTNQPAVCQPFFVKEQVQDVDATYLFSLINPEFSPAGSTRRELEETMMDNFQDFLMALDEGPITGYDCPVAWNYSEDHPGDILEPNTEGSFEKFDTAELTSAGVMGWLTGQKHRQLNGQKVEIIAKFDHECLMRNPSHTICFPLVGACGMEITFPVNHMKGYDAFKNVFLLALCKGQAFAKP